MSYQTFYRNPRYNWVEHGGNDHRTKEEYPYGYSDHYLWGNEKTAKDCSCAYSDRFRLWADADHYAAAKRAAGSGDYWNQWGRDGVQRFINAFYPGKKLVVTALAEGCNVSNGYPYWIVWWKEAE